MPHILLLYEMFIPSVRLCAYEQLKYLEEQGKVTFKHCEVKKVTRKMCLECDIVILVRGYSVLEEKLVAELKKQDKMLIYVLDDDLLNIADGLASSNYFKLDIVKNRIQNIMRMCDILITPSIILADKYKMLFKRTVIIEEPCLPYKVKEKKQKSKVKIGFAGSIDREGDIDSIITEVIRELNHKYKGKISIEFMGAKPKIVEELKLTYYPYEGSYDTYKEMIANANWDIGLAPMPDTEFHRCKYYNKFIEYSSASIIGVYSDLEPYTQIISHKKDGLLCSNTKQSWIEQVSWLIDHDAEREEIRHRIEMEMKEKFAISIVAEQFYSDIPELSNFKAKRCKNIPLELIKLTSLIIKALEFVKRNGIKSPLLIFKKVSARIIK